MDWWQLPGPASFVDDIATDLREGKNVLICMPENCPPGLRSAMRTTIGNGILWRTLSLGESGKAAPLDWLLDYFHSSRQTLCGDQTIEDLTGRESFTGRVLWVEDINLERWPEWSSFICDYQHVCRGVELLRRTVFCIYLTGKASIVIPREDVCLTIHKYDGEVSPLDTRIYADHQAGARYDSGIVETLRLEIIAVLAQWDGPLVEKLMPNSLEDLLEIGSYLKREAYARGWLDGLCLREDEAWALGFSYRMNGRPVWHSSICAHTNPDEFRVRIWQAQVRVLFPFIEEQRQILLRQLKPIFRIPYTTRSGEVIEDYRDLEIGHIETLLIANGRFRQSELLQRVGALKRIRNSLSHFEIVGPFLLASQAVLEPLME